MNQRTSKNDQTFAGVFLIGMAILFLTGWWWPGILFVIGVAMAVRAVNEGRSWTDDRNALVMLGLGVVFLLLDFLGDFGSIWPFMLIAVGAYLLFGKNLTSGRLGSAGKSKRDDVV